MVKEPPPPPYETCDPDFFFLVQDECHQLYAEFPEPVKMGLARRWEHLGVVALDEPDPRLHPDAGRETFGDCQVTGRRAVIHVYRGPLERYHADCVAGRRQEPVITVQEHVRRVLLHEFAHACGMRHEDLAPYGI